MPPSRRDDLIDAAMRVFYRQGFHASALDSILEEGDLSRMTLYSHFRSKDELLIAALRRRDEIFRNRMVKFVEAKANTARERLLAVFDYHEQWFTSDEFCGCMFINTAAEFSDPRSAPRQISAEHKSAIERYLSELSAACGVARPDEIAEQLNILLEGAIVTAQVVGKVKDGGADPGASARVARKMAEQILIAAADS